MDTRRASSKHAIPRPSLLMRGESAVASVGLAVAAIVVAAVAGSGYWLIRAHRLALEEVRQQQVAAVADVIAPAAEHLLAAGRPTPVRRMLIDAANHYDLSHCRIVLPDGEVIADSNLSRIDTTLRQVNWERSSTDDPGEAITAVSGGMLVVNRPLVFGRGRFARLEMLGQMDPPFTMLWRAQAGAGLVGIGALLALLLVYRHFRRRLQAVGVIREALLAMQRGETVSSALAVGSQLGKEAAAWNLLLSEQQELRQQVALDRARQSQGTEVGGDLSNACDAVSHGLMMVDEQLRIHYANHAAGVFLHVSRDEAASRHLDELVEDQALIETVRQAAGGQLRRRVTCEMRRSDDGDGVLRFNVHPVRRGDVARAMIVIDDITQQRVAEDARHQFVTQATHELRTPLTNLRLYLEMLQEEGQQDPVVRAQALNVLNQETYRLDRMVSDMLSVAEIEAGSIEVSRDDVQVAPVLRDIETYYQASAREKQVSLSFNIPPKLPIVQGDRDKLMLAMQNLVSNAIKYTDAGGQVAVRAESDQNQLTVEVNDTGIGIAPDDLEHVFEKFYRASDKRLSHIPGSGLGLALAREIVRLHGGEITVESKLDQGSTFTLTLPACAENDTATE